MSICHKPAVAGLALAAALLPFSSSALTVDLLASKDTTMWENGRVNGTGQPLFAGLNGQNVVQRAMIAFDLSSIAAGSIINSVTFKLHMNSQSSSGGAETINLHRMTADWNEAAAGGGSATGGGGSGAPAVAGDATWTHSGLAAWTTPGGDFDPTSSASIVTSGFQFYNFTGANLVQDVQDWIDGNNGNFGWAIIGNETTLSASKRFSSSENTGSDVFTGDPTVPVLQIDYTPAVVPVPAAVWLLGSGLLGLIGVARRKRA